MGRRSSASCIERVALQDALPRVRDKHDDRIACAVKKFDSEAKLPKRADGVLAQAGAILTATAIPRGKSWWHDYDGVVERGAHGDRESAPLHLTMQ
jgi:hypothetical protein